MTTSGDTPTDPTVPLEESAGGADLWGLPRLESELGRQLEESAGGADLWGLPRLESELGRQLEELEASHRFPEGDAEAKVGTITLTGGELVEVFTEWDRRYREDPTTFDSDVERFLRGQTVEEYGDSAAATMLGFLEELRSSRSS